jgi:hypothetical protein
MLRKPLCASGLTTLADKRQAGSAAAFWFRARMDNMTRINSLGLHKQDWIWLPFAVLITGYVAINLFHIGGEALVITLNNNIANPLALTISILAIFLCFSLKARGKNLLLWLGLAAGWLLATIAEFWWAIAAMMEKGTPYPSWADLFWVASYIPMLVALILRSGSLPHRHSRTQPIAFIVATSISLGCTFVFVLLPILREARPDAFIENTLDLLYPILDLCILLVVLRLLFSYRQGVYGRAWAWLSAGFIIQSIANLLFSYASISGRYYPNDRINLLSTLGIDIPYNLSYLIWLIGLYLVYRIHRSYVGFPNPSTLPLLEPVPNTHILLFLSPKNEILSASLNYGIAFSLDSPQGKTLTAALGAPAEEVDEILRKIETAPGSPEQEIRVTSRWGEQIGWISGTRSQDPEGNPAGTTLLLRMFTRDYTLDELLTPDDKRSVLAISSQSGGIQLETQQVKEFLANYYLTYLKSLYNRMLTEGGSLMAEAFLTELQQFARSHSWDLDIQQNTLVNINNAPLAVIRQALPALFETAKRFVARVADEATVESALWNVRKHFSGEIEKSVEHFEKNPA